MRPFLEKQCLTFLKSTFLKRDPAVYDLTKKKEMFIISPSEADHSEQLDQNREERPRPLCFPMFLLCFNSEAL